jgi:uncharacterized phiE125 gp8 family phage protein
MQNYNLVISVKDITDQSGEITEPVTVTEFKQYARMEGFQDVDESDYTPIAFTDDDDLIEQLIITARKRLEKVYGISIVTKTLRATLTNLAGDIEIPCGPLIEVTTLTDRYGTAIDEDDYTVVGDDFAQLECPRYEKMVMVYEAGYTDVPEPLKTEILRMVLYLYENRGDKEMRGYSFGSREYNRNTWLA